MRCEPHPYFMTGGLGSRPGRCVLRSSIAGAIEILRVHRQRTIMLGPLWSDKRSQLGLALHFLG